MDDRTNETTVGMPGVPANPNDLEIPSHQPLDAFASQQPSQPQIDNQAQQPAQAPPQFQQAMPPTQNIYITQQVQQAPGVMIAVAPKSVFVAFLLTFFFGPLGMFYSTVMGAVIMLVISIVAIPLTVGIAALITWPICIVWGCVAASQHNTRIASQTMTQIAR